MKIVFLSFYSGAVERGVENWVLNLSKGLSKKHKVIVYQAGDKIQEKYYQQIKVKVNWDFKDEIDSLLMRFYLDRWSRKIALFTKKVLKIIPQDTDIIIPTNNGWQTVLCRLYALFQRKKIIIVGHSGIGFDDRRNLFCLPDYFVALGKTQFQWARKQLIKPKITTIANGVDLNYFSPQGEKAQIDLPKPIILLVSALIPWKRVDLTIKAVSQLKKGSLVILGRGDKKNTKAIQELGDRLLPGRFLLTSVSHQEIAKWYRACDLVTFPAGPWEAFGMVLLEAMACNKKVVTSSDPTRADLVGEAGIVTDPQNIKVYAQDLDKALKTDFKDKPLKQAQKYSWDNIVAQYNKLFSTL